MRRGHTWAALAIGTVLTLCMLWPMFDAHEGMATADGVIMAWNQWHTSERLIHGQTPLWTDLWIYPHGMSLAKHTLSPGFAPVSLLVRAVTDSPLWPFYALRVIVFGSFVALWVLTYYLLRMCGGNRVASGIVATCFAFSNFFIIHAQYPQFVALWCFPLCTILLLRFHRAPSLARLLVLSVAIGGSVYFTEMMVFWCMAMGLAVLFYAASRAGRIDLQRVICTSRWYWWPVAGACAVAVAAPFLAAFMGAESGSLSHTASELSLRHGMWLFWLGWMIPASAFAYFARKRAWWPLAATAAILLILSMGPNLEVAGTTYEGVMPFTSLSKIPPFTDFRAPYRLTVVALFVLLVPAARALSQVRNGIGLTAIAAIAVFECVTPRMYFSEDSRSVMALRNAFATPSPAFIERIEAQPDGLWASYPPMFYDTAGVYAQLFHHQPIVAGFWVSRWSPDATDDWREYFDLAQTRDTEAMARWLIEHGVKNVLLTGGESWPAPGLTPESVSGLNVVDVRDVALDPFMDMALPDVLYAKR